MASSTTIDVELESDDQEKGRRELQFQDFPHTEEEKGNSQTHTFSNFPHTAESDEDDSEKTEFLQEEKKAAPSFWTFEYYQQFFDVETRQVLVRIGGSMLPHPRRNFLTTHIRPNPDLYGPFWICTTLVFTTAIAGNLANYLQSAGNNYMWKYDFHKVTFAATAIFSYWWLIPLCLFGLLWWRGNQSRFSFLEILCVYGYSLAIYIPISVLWVIQVNWLQWLLVMLGAALSGSVLLLTFWPAVREESKRIGMAVMALIFIFHAALAVGFVLYFFHVPAVAPTPVPLAPSANLTTKTVPLLEKAAQGHGSKHSVNRGATQPELPKLPPLGDTGQGEKTAAKSAAAGAPVAGPQNTSSTSTSSTSSKAQNEPPAAGSQQAPGPGSRESQASLPAQGRESQKLQDKPK